MLLTLALALTVGAGAQAGGPTGGDAAAGVVRGSVTDLQQALVFGARVVIYNEERRIELTTDTNGEFQTPAPKGTYHIQAHFRHFCTASRAPFELAANSAVTINLTLVVSPIVNRIYKEPDAPVTETDRHECPFRIEKVSPPRARKAGSEVWIQFGESNKAGSSNCYSGYFSERKPQRVIVTYDALTLYADKVCLNDKGELVAYGAPTVETGDGAPRSLNAGDSLNYRELVIRVAPK